MRSAPAWLWLILLVVVGLGIAAAHDGCMALNPHVSGYFDPESGSHTFEDNGDRFIQACLMFCVVGMTAWAAFRLVQIQRKDVSDRRWTWEVVVAGEVYKRPPPDAGNIRGDMEAFNGKQTGCTLTDNDSGSRLWCTGEPDRRVVGAHLVRDGMFGDYTLARRNDVNTELVPIQADRILRVPAREVLTGAEALEVLLAFLAGQPLPAHYAWEPADPRRTG